MKAAAVSLVLLLLLLLLVAIAYTSKPKATAAEVGKPPSSAEVAVPQGANRDAGTREAPAATAPLQPGVPDADPRVDSPAAAPPTSTITAGAGEAQVLIWGGGRTPEEATKALERFNSERNGLEALLALGEGYPRVVVSDTLPGLNPGFNVVVLGVCTPEEAKAPLKVLQSFSPGVYARAARVATAPGSCPKHENKLEFVDVERLAQKPYELVAVTFMASDPAASPVPWLVRLYLRDAQGSMVDQTAVDPRDGMWEGTAKDTCLPQAFAEPPHVRVSVQCDTLAGGPWPKERHSELKYRVSAGKIEWVSKP